MKNLLFHVSDKIYPVLLPKQNDNYEKSICLSENCFISHFGQYLYIFEKQILHDNFCMKEVSTEGLHRYICLNTKEPQEIRFRSDSLGKEYRIYRPIDIDKFCLGIVEHFNHLKGELETRMMDYSFNEMRKDHKRIDFSEKRTQE